MNNTHAITNEQLAILRGLTCERLTSNPSNESLLESFACERGPGLVNTLVNFAWERDQQGGTAYYLIKNPAGEILMFFSLKCGTLFNPNYLSNFAKQYEKISGIWEDLNGPDAPDIRRKLGSERFEELKEQVGEAYDFKQDAMNRIKFDKMFERNRKIIRVDSTHPAIELVDFAANDNAAGYWKSLNLGHSMGKTLFWWFIVPRMMEINALIGCEFAYLFAADEEPYGTLYRYYRKHLHFESFEDLGTAKPYYDMTCLFMVKNLLTPDLNEIPEDARNMMTEADFNQLRGLDYFRKHFFDNFNA